MTKSTLGYFKKLLKSLMLRINKYWQKNILTKLVCLFLSLFILFIAAAYSIAQWYILSNKDARVKYGVSFIPDYANSLGLNPEQTMDALLNINVKMFRLVSYWSDIEPTPGQYDFSQLDWQFNKAATHHAKIVLVVGLRQPRWPECHPPNWVNTAMPEPSWQPQLEAFMTKVIERYKNSPSLYEYQLENEYFLHGFGQCNNFDRSRLVSEYSLVKSLDPSHPIIVGRSNNAIGFPSGQPTPDLFGISIYKRVWDAAITHRYIEYPYPAWYYAFIAGTQKLFLGKDMVIDEMQSEAWAPNNKSVQQVSLSEQNKSLDAKRLKERFSFAKASGMKQIDMWGAEYWYYRLKVLSDPSLWNEAKNEFSSNQ